MQRLKIPLFVLAIVLLVTSALWAAPVGQDRPGSRPDLNDPRNRDAQRLANLAEEVRHELVMLSNYSVFDWLEAVAKLDGSVTLKGEVVEPVTKSNAERRVKSLESVSKVINNIEVLPLSPTDNELRVAIYRAIYNFNSPLFRYATQAVPPIHVIVKNGNVTLKGVVDSESDATLAFTAARQVGGAFSVKNELNIARHQKTSQ